MSSGGCCGGESEKTKQQVSEYYGKTLKTTSDLKTDACCSAERPPEYVLTVLSKIHAEVKEKYYGCGLCIPHFLDGTNILDLGSGAGRDVYLCSALAGESGRVVGVDMTEEQLSVARQHQQFHAQAFGHSAPNTDFKFGYIEKLADVGLPSDYFDVIISNCVINLSTDKPAVFREAFRVLKEGGELYFSDVYADRRVPQELVQNEVLYGECLSGALYWNDFLSLARAAGFSDPRLVECKPLAIKNAEVEKLIGHICFHSATYRLFKAAGLESSSENYGQTACYKGSIATCPSSFVFDNKNVFPANQPVPVCGNTAKMLNVSRFASHFVISEKGPHLGIFNADSPFTATSPAAPAQAGGSCCAAPAPAKATEGCCSSSSCC